MTAPTSGPNQSDPTSVDPTSTHPASADPSPPRNPATGHHPTVAAEAAHRSADLQLAIADKITSFAGSMLFVYAHAILFAAWMLFIEKSPWQTLTLIVSLEAIFLSTFVMIGQNRQAAFQQAKADRDFSTGEQELHLNTELTRQIHELTKQIQRQTSTGGPTATGT
jgi:uncharacterized membrane protein